jgi:hypothetical protein
MRLVGYTNSGDQLRNKKIYLLEKALLIKAREQGNGIFFICLR